MKGAGGEKAIDLIETLTITEVEATHHLQQRDIMPTANTVPLSLPQLGTRTTFVTRITTGVVAVEDAVQVLLYLVTTTMSAEIVVEEVYHRPRHHPGDVHRVMMTITVAIAEGLDEMIHDHPAPIVAEAGVVDTEALVPLVEEDGLDQIPEAFLGAVAEAVDTRT